MMNFILYFAVSLCLSLFLVKLSEKLRSRRALVVSICIAIPSCWLAFMVVSGSPLFFNVIANLSKKTDISKHSFSGSSSSGVSRDFYYNNRPRVMAVKVIAPPGDKALEKELLTALQKEFVDKKLVPELYFLDGVHSFSEEQVDAVMVISLHNFELERNWDLSMKGNCSGEISFRNIYSSINNSFCSSSWSGCRAQKLTRKDGQFTVATEMIGYDNYRQAFVNQVATKIHDEFLKYFKDAEEKNNGDRITFEKAVAHFPKANLKALPFALTGEEEVICGYSQPDYFSRCTSYALLRVNNKTPNQFKEYLLKLLCDDKWESAYSDGNDPVSDYINDASFTEAIGTHKDIQLRLVGRAPKSNLTLMAMSVDPGSPTLLNCPTSWYSSSASNSPEQDWVIHLKKEVAVEKKEEVDVLRQTAKRLMNSGDKVAIGSVLKRSFSMLYGEKTLPEELLTLAEHACSKFSNDYRMPYFASNLHNLLAEKERRFLEMALNRIGKDSSFFKQRLELNKRLREIE